MLKSVRITIWLMAMLPLCMMAQQEPVLSNQRMRLLALSTQSQGIDSLTVLPNSLRLFADTIQLDASFYQFFDNKITLDSAAIQSYFKDNPEVTITYRVAPYNLGQIFRHIDTTQVVLSSTGEVIGLTYDPYADPDPGIIEFKGLDYNGTFARGISFGNNQNLVLNSAFNLQLAGNVGNGVEVLAAISDNNIPLQPEGNTQQLNDFDRIFIQISKNNNKLIAGDYELAVRPPQSYFMNYFKKMQGATVSNLSRVFDDKANLYSSGSIAISRGKTQRQLITAEEGNQGPYRLEGAEGERFIIILAGTERVWIDGKLLTRGIEGDYIIDYNAGDITFTPNMLITSVSRIIIEFEYSVENYTRSMYAVDVELTQGDKFNAYFHLFSEQDGKTPIDGEFSQAERDSLFQAGDDPLRATTSGITQVEEFTAFRVLYKLVPNPEANICNAPDSILVYSTDPDSALYAARFSRVSNGTGFYNIDTENLANGTVYQYAGCENPGNYVARIQLITPEQQQLYTLGGTYNFSKKNKLRGELALSNRDENRISPNDDGDNLGIGAFIDWENELEFAKDWSIETDVTYEFKQDRFEDLNQYRPAEFVRDWNIENSESIRVNEHLGLGKIGIRHDQLGSLSYQFSGFLRDSLYEGRRQVANYQLLKNGWEVSATANLLETDGQQENTRFFRPNFSVVVPFLRDSTGQKYWRVGVAGEREFNERFSKNENREVADTLDNSSFWFDIFNAFVETPESDRFNFRAGFRQRYDYMPVEDDFELSMVGSELNIQTTFRNLRKDKKNRRYLSNLGINFTYRELDIKDASLTDFEPSETFLGRLNHSWTLFNGAIQTNTTYEVGSGQERRVEFFFDENLEGTGAYIWNDYNQDSVIQVTEVEIDPFGNGTVDRFVRYTDGFIRTNNVIFNQALRIEPKAIWFSEKTGIKKVLKLFSSQSSFQINRKVRNNADASPWNPFDLEIADTSLVSTNSNIRNTLFFNRGNPVFDIQLGMSLNEIKSLLSSGFDSRRNTEQFLRGRWNFDKKWSLSAEIALGNKQRFNETAAENNFEIKSIDLQPGIRWQPSNNFRAGVAYQFSSSENILGTTGENATQHDLTWELKFNQSNATSIESEFSFVQVDFEGEANSAVGFAFLNGLQNGRNFIWSITLDRRLAQNIQLSIGYEGRRTGTAPVIHIGRAQMAATF